MSESILEGALFLLDNVVDFWEHFDAREMRELGAPEDGGLLGVGMIYPEPASLEPDPPTA